MVLLHMVTWIPSIYPLYVGIYTSTMDPMGMGLGKWNHISLTWIVRPFGDDSLYLNHDSSEGEQWGRYNLPRLVFYNHTITMNPPSIFRLYHICLYVCMYVRIYICIIFITYIYIHTEVSWNGDTPSSSIYKWIFPYKPSISSTPNLGNPNLACVRCVWK